MLNHHKEINSWLHQTNNEYLVIYGMGGSGKTTLAKYVYNMIRRFFESVSFVEDIGNICKGPNDILQFQKQLLEDILGGKNRKIPGVSRGTCMIEEALQMKRTLIVLDDIVEHSQLVALLGTGRINAQSKIIITTRVNTNNWPLMRCKMYPMRLLNDDESLQLIRLHAFGSKIPNLPLNVDPFLILDGVKYCEGNPLALEVFGSSMFKNNTISHWKSHLSLLEKDMDSRLQCVLIRSYMSLPYNSDKELFLHIACFFIGKDMDYVVKILEPDYSAITRIKTLINRCLLSVSPNKKLTMHRLLQEMGKNIIRQESTKFPAKRSRVWLSSDSYKILSEGEGSKLVEGFALDMKMLPKEDFAFTEDRKGGEICLYLKDEKRFLDLHDMPMYHTLLPFFMLYLQSSELKTEAFKKMVNLKLLQLNFVELSGSYEYISEDLRWLCWHGFHLTTIPSDLYMGNLVAIDMSYSKLEVFEPPMVVLRSLQILNLKDSHDLIEIRNIIKIPHLETLILWNCYSLVYVCKSIVRLKSLELLNMTGCKNLFGHQDLSAASTSAGDVKKQATIFFPCSLHRLFLKDCNLERTDSFSGGSLFKRPYLQYLNLVNSRFECFPCNRYFRLRDIRVLDLSLCSRLKTILCLPYTLAELYIYDCELLERITFEHHRFTLQEFGYEGCINLYEIEGFLKLIPVSKLDETDLGQMNWLQKYQNHEVCLVGDDELTTGRSLQIQMLYEFGIMSTSLPDIRDPNMTYEYISKSSSLSFDIPSCPKNKRLEGVNVTFKYAISGEDCAWFCKISTANGVYLMYNPKVFGKPEFGKVCIWLSYMPIGYKLKIRDRVNVSIVGMRALEVHECGLNLVYSDVESVENNIGLTKRLEGDLSGFQLSTGAYYLCRRDFFELMEVGRLTPDWFRRLVGDTIDYAEVRGWRKTGRPKQVNDPSYTELKTFRCIIDGPESVSLLCNLGFLFSRVGGLTGSTLSIPTG
ncbi:putative P-loop containing nucleoside triphosphate hydrolase, leucine-rich repeat domain superfamily [Helianthus annuus]|nr:putative P-loop containing nucleoside triphosphate hydrolase, leucine-rich repeat domain superfamily [Helianthus annuus]